MKLDQTVVNVTQDAAAQAAGRKMLFLLIAVFSLPVLLVTMMYFLNFRPSGSSYGLLIAPAVKVNYPANINAFNGKTLKSIQAEEKWKWVMLQSGACTKTCESKLIAMRKLHLSLGKELDRLQRVVLYTELPSESELKIIQSRYPDLIIVAADTPDYQHFIQQFQHVSSTPSFFMVVDPIGNLMMRYPEDADLKGVRKDMQRLLTYSWAG